MNRQNVSKKKDAAVKKQYAVDKAVFRSEKDREAAARDLETITRLQKETDYGDPESVLKLARYLESGRCRFETSLGRQFDDDIYELARQYRNHADAGAKGKKQAGRGAAASGKKKGDRRTKSSPSAYTDEELKPFIEKELKKKENRRRGFLVSFLLLGAGCLGYFIFYMHNNRQSADRFQELSQLIGSEALSSKKKKEPSVTFTEDNYVVPDVLADYETLYNSNKKLIGWIKIDDTIIDYPVLQCDNNEYYLNHNFDQKEDRCGAIFLDYRCDVIRGCDNFIVYGHHMSSGKMFAKLEDYESEKYYEKHPFIQFDTIYEKQTFQVMYVFRSRVYNEEDVVFKYYDFIKANSEMEFQSYMREMAELSFYDTSVTASYGDQLLTMSTCDYNEANGRFVVVAKRIQ